MSSQTPLRIGTRASKLALAQSGMMQRRIAVALGASLDEADDVAPLIQITTSGDRAEDRLALKVGGDGLFTKEIEEALLEGRIDCAVHSLKDMSTESPPGLSLAAIPEREDPRDAFISHRFDSLDAMSRGARLGAPSARRAAQCLRRRPELKIVMVRGNVDSRLAKLERGEADAIVLAVAGLNRLGLAHLPRALIDPMDAPPAPGQGALGIQTRVADRDAPWLVGLRHRPSTLAVTAERGALAAVEGSCETAIGAYATLDRDRLSLIVEALTPDGARRFRRFGETDVGGAGGGAAAWALGLRLGSEVRAEGGEALVRSGSGS